MIVQRPDGSSARLLFRASFNQMDDEFLSAEDQGVQFRSHGRCMRGSSCQSHAALSLNSAYLHINQVKHWTKFEGEKDRQMSCSTSVIEGLRRILHSCALRKEAEGKLKACTNDVKKLEAAYNEALVVERPFLHIFFVPVEYLPCGGVDLSNDFRRVKSCKAFGNLCSGCLSQDHVRYAERWGNSLKEIILERVPSADLQYVTLDYYRDNEFVRLSFLMED